jgi:hypothetical protein
MERFWLYDVILQMMSHLDVGSDGQQQGTAVPVVIQDVSNT